MPPPVNLPTGVSNLPNGVKRKSVEFTEEVDNFITSGASIP